jgi:hypothetical protein
MEPVSHVPPCARPFTANVRTMPSVTMPSVRSMGSQTDERCGSSSMTTQTPTSACTCTCCTAVPGSLKDGKTCATKTSMSTSNTEPEDQTDSTPVLSDSKVKGSLKEDESKQGELKTEGLTHNASQSCPETKEAETSEKRSSQCETGDDGDSSQKKVTANTEVHRNPEGDDIILADGGSLVQAMCESEDHNKDQGVASKSNDANSDIEDKTKDPIPNKPAVVRGLRKRKSGSKEEEKKSITDAGNQNPRRSKRKNNK